MLRSLLAPAYGHALRVLYSRTGLPWTVHDQVVRIDPQARHLVPHDGEPALFEFLAHTIRPGDIVLDVGAFVGVYAVLAARWSGPGGRVVAFEPTPSSAALARRHLAFNGLGPDRVSLIEAAVSDRAARATLHQYDASAMPYVNSLVAAVDTDAPAVTRQVDVVTIDEVCRELEIRTVGHSHGRAGRGDSRAARRARDDSAAPPGCRSWSKCTRSAGRRLASRPRTPGTRWPSSA